MSTHFANIVIGTASSKAIHAADLGKTIVLDGKTYRLVKANAAIAAAANKVVCRTAGTAGTWTVDVSAALDNPLVAGVIPAGQKGSTGTTGLISGDYFYLQVGGEATPIIVTTATAVGKLLSVTASNGASEAITSVTDVKLGGVFAVVLVASSGASAATQARLVNLI